MVILFPQRKSQNIVFLDSGRDVISFFSKNKSITQIKLETNANLNYNEQIINTHHKNYTTYVEKPNSLIGKAHIN